MHFKIVIYSGVTNDIFSITYEGKLTENFDSFPDSEDGLKCNHKH